MPITKAYSLIAWKVIVVESIPDPFVLDTAFGYYRLEFQLTAILKSVLKSLLFTEAVTRLLSTTIM
jgi:hypothetical protein